MAKMLYLIWPDHVYIDKCIEAGIDTLIVAVYSLPGDKNTGNYFDTWEQTLDVFKRYHDKVKCIALPVIYEFFEDLPESQCFMQANKYYRRSFCPTSEEHIKWRLGPFKELYEKGLCHEVILDTEHYTGAPMIYSEEVRCDCPRCAGMSWEDQWKTRAGMIKKYPMVTGQMWSHKWWGLSCYPNPSWLLSEETYMVGSGEGCSTKFGYKREQASAKKKHNVKYRFIPGAWIEPCNGTDKFLDYLKYLKSNSPYEGYWIYTQKMFSRWSKMDKGQIEDFRKSSGFYEERLVDEVDPNFFTKLKAIN